VFEGGAVRTNQGHTGTSIIDVSFFLFLNQRHARRIFIYIIDEQAVLVLLEVQVLVEVLVLLQIKTTFFVVLVIGKSSCASNAPAMSEKYDYRECSLLFRLSKDKCQERK
jgi:hypothetical protein